jgi:hypothetical protein
MRAAAAIGRYWTMLLMSVALQLSQPVSSSVLSWSNYWWSNRSAIVLFTAVNTTITTVSEAGTRELWPLLTGQQEHGFFVSNEQGATRIHTQSLISIIMTFFASLLGGPVYFIRSGRYRFLFFLGFGTCNSLLSQGVVSFFRDGVMHFAAKRFYFDFLYNGTLKFILFETSRRPILKRRRSFVGVATVRSVQDFFTTAFRVIMLNLIGLKG